MQEKYLNYLTHSLKEYGEDQQVNKYVDLFPELDSRLVKFAEGILLWNKKSLINLDNPDDVSRIRIMLRVLDETPGFDFFDNVFNEADPDTVCEIIGISSVSPMGQSGTIEYDFSVEKIKNYDDAYSYLEAVSWCIVISEESFKAYTANGNRFYFCSNSDWRDIPCVPGIGFPKDAYGYSLIAVEVTPDHQISSITSRWNTCGEESEHFISEQELRTILGEENYKKLFV
ncbi:MAG: hypothetical protein K2F93_07530 [Muribaculaceae bacterium]|nr:hypothetical protein [Muribaculaceae bacterium]